MLKKKIKKIITFLLLVIVCVQTGKAQDFLFSQFYSNPLYLNPALAGAAVCPRFTLAYRNQWPSLPGSFMTTTASYDQYFAGISGGLGVFIANDQHGAFSTNMLSVMYAYRLKVSNKLYVSAALKASIVSDGLDWNSLQFPDQIDPVYGFINTSTAGAPSGGNNVFYPDFGAGIVAYNDYFYAGAAFDHLTQPDQGFYGQSKLPMKVTVHAGGLLNVNASKRRTSPLGLKSPVFSPNIVYQHMLNSNYLNYGLYFDWLPVIIGVWFRQGFENADALIFLVGIQQPSFKVGYSYDLTISSLIGSTGGSHEITLGFKLPCPKKKVHTKEIKCPEF